MYFITLCVCCFVNIFCSSPYLCENIVFSCFAYTFSPFDLCILSNSYTFCKGTGCFKSCSICTNFSYLQTIFRLLPRCMAYFALRSLALCPRLWLKIDKLNCFYMCSFYSLSKCRTPEVKTKFSPNIFIRVGWSQQIQVKTSWKVHTNTINVYWHKNLWNIGLGNHGYVPKSLQTNMCTRSFLPGLNIQLPYFFILGLVQKPKLLSHVDDSLCSFCCCSEFWGIFNSKRVFIQKISQCFSYLNTPRLPIPFYHQTAFSIFMGISRLLLLE